jgi:hypothetical protein
MLHSEKSFSKCNKILESRILKSANDGEIGKSHRFWQAGMARSSLPFRRIIVTSSRLRSCRRRYFIS